MIVDAKDQELRNRAHWNQALWLANDFGLYTLVCDAIRISSTKKEAVRDIHGRLTGALQSGRTPDGVPWSLAGIRAHVRDVWDDT